MLPIIIGLSGKKQSGKSTVAKYLVQYHEFAEVSWAYPLKEIVGRKLFGLNDSQLYGDGPEREKIVEKWGMSPRRILQLVGTEMFRKHILDDFWVIKGVDHIRHMLEYDMKLSGLKHIVISDCRFPNEMKAIKELGGHTIRVVRTDQESTDVHLSETSLDDYDFDLVIEAKSGQIQTLHNQIHKFVDGLKMGSILR